eukprot:632615-Pleurochrysis_carterae.AAC.2
MDSRSWLVVEGGESTTKPRVEDSVREGAPSLVGEKRSARAGLACTGRVFLEGAQRSSGVGGRGVVVRQDGGKRRVDDPSERSQSLKSRERGMLHRLAQASELLERGVDDDAPANAVGDVRRHETSELVARLHSLPKPMPGAPHDCEKREPDAVEVVGDGLPRHPGHD